MLTRSYRSDAFPSLSAFDLISSALSDEEERKDAIKKGGAIFAFTLKNGQNETSDWFIDLKDSGKVGKGTGPDGKKANGMSRLSFSVAPLRLVLLGDEMPCYVSSLHV